ncbi:MAG: TIR domain-containing protein [Cyanothece sp. SIO2G6]|nr:TIR domain-containing protein [Cyanothece sp. SIO2G6]
MCSTTDAVRSLTTMTSFQHIFISYGPLDSADFVQRLGDRLRQAQLTVSVLADGTDLEAAVIRADHFLFVISPSAVNSPVCNRALAIALRHHKRILPLMHVETLTYDCWKNRNPDGTDADWQTYQDKGLHSSLIHLHPAIATQEWIDFPMHQDSRNTDSKTGSKIQNPADGDTLDDPYQHLLDTIAKQEDYARNHTILLAKALAWDQSDRQPDNLLTEEMLQVATDWLKTRYEGMPYACQPTDLQRELIAASLERVEPVMTQAFLCYAPADEDWSQQVRNALQQSGLAVWHPLDSGGREDGRAIAEQAIERTDNLIYLSSPHAQTASGCQAELVYAQSQHKRIIVLQREGTNGSHLAANLQAVPQIDWPSQTEGQQEAIAQLITVLQDNAEYYAYHKALLVKALHWSRHQCAEDELLQGKDFVDAVAWLETGKQTQTDAPPTRLHEKFIAASKEKNRFFDGFISYGRPDSLEFATQLHAALGDAGFNVWFDKMDIPFGVDFQAQIDDGIERSHNFIFLISPHSTQSVYCRKEIELAVKLNKRIIPLMHVEQITVETWQQRHPGAPLAAWEAYKAQGKHSSYNHIHPEIGKINWIFFREGIDAFDRSLIDLTTLLHQHERYVQLHTDLLIKALAWKRRQYAHQYLLLGESRRQAELWLQQEFKDEQAPCQPTDLQCELIAESRKYASNFSTQVFLCGAAGEQSESEIAVESQIRQALAAARPAPQSGPADAPLAPAVASEIILIRRLLLRAGFTVWTSSTDIRSGDQVKDAIARGIEGADNFIFLLTNASVESRQCLRELNYALSLNKRIIPVLLTPIPVGDLPTSLQTLQLIDFTPFTKSKKIQASGALNTVLATLQQLDTKVLADTGISGKGDRPLRQSVRQLIKALRENEIYYSLHQQLLTIALKWDRQRRNPALLFRGKTLRQYQSWMKLAQQHPQHPPTALQTAFITASEAQPPNPTLDVFIAYAPEDVEFARKLNDTLQIQGQTTWFEDTTLISSGEDQSEGHNPDQTDLHEVNQAIEQSTNFLFIISPASLHAPNCLEQLNYANQLNKRLVPVLHLEVMGQTLPVLGQSAWIDFSRPEGDFLTTFGDLYRILESDPDHIRPHTRLMVKAKEWEQSGRDDGFLLRGQDLATAETWLRQSQDKMPQPTMLQRDYIKASQERPLRKIGVRPILWTSGIVAVVVFLLNLFVDMPFTLSLYDAMMRSRPSEPQDDRFLLVTVNESAGTWLREQLKAKRYQPSIGTIPDAALKDALDILTAYQPRVIGLDFYRDFDADPELAQRLRQTENLIGLCKASFEGQGVTPPPELPIERVGLNDLLDDGGQSIRRQYLMQAPDPDFCNTRESFSLKLAQLYLATEGVPFESPLYEGADGLNHYRTNGMKIGPATIPQLEWRTGPSLGGPENYRGYQTLVNFRTYQGSMTEFAPQVSLAEVLTGQLEPEQVRDRVVVMLYTDTTDRNADIWNTPYGEISGGILQAQMASQLISAALDNRPLIRWWPVWGEAMWIGLWAIAGGFALWPFRRVRSLVGGAIVALLILYGTCTIILITTAIWVPVVPAAIALLLTGSRVVYLNYRLRNG